MNFTLWNYQKQPFDDAFTVGEIYTQAKRSILKYYVVTRAIGDNDVEVLSNKLHSPAVNFLGGIAASSTTSNMESTTAIGVESITGANDADSIVTTTDAAALTISATRAGDANIEVSNVHAHISGIAVFGSTALDVNFAESSSFGGTAAELGVTGVVIERPRFVAVNTTAASVEQQYW